MCMRAYTYSVQRLLDRGNQICRMHLEIYLNSHFVVL